MRTIGKRNIKKLRTIVQEEYDKRKAQFYMLDYEVLSQAIRERIPDEWYDIWEGAYAEINRIVDDVICHR